MTVINTVCIESQYQTVIKRSETNSNGFERAEELLKRLVPHKSFLYRQKTKISEKSTSSYVPMNPGTEKKPEGMKKFFRVTSYDSSSFNPRIRFSKIFEDRGYYIIKSNSKAQNDRIEIKKDSRKYKSLSVTNTNEISEEDHYYEDLCYHNVNEIQTNESISDKTNQSKPTTSKIQELLKSFKLPFLKKTEHSGDKHRHEKLNEEVRIDNEFDSGDLYDSVITAYSDKENKLPKEGTNIPEEDYLEPIKLSEEQKYCDVFCKQKEESLMGYIWSLFGNRFWTRRDITDDWVLSDSSEDANPKESATLEKNSNITKSNMVDRPLPVPVENEPYYMEIDRTEAENLLRGQPDGTFVLRPSSQPNHVYTLSVSCSGEVHNIGIYRLADGRMALGLPKEGRPGFTRVSSLLRRHQKKRLLLLSNGDVVAATVLTSPPQYYQTPRASVMSCRNGDFL